LDHDFFNPLDTAPAKVAPSLDDRSRKHPEVPSDPLLFFFLEMLPLAEQQYRRSQKHVRVDDFSAFGLVRRRRGDQGSHLGQQHQICNLPEPAHLLTGDTGVAALRRALAAPGVNPTGLSASSRWGSCFPMIQGQIIKTKRKFLGFFLAAPDSRLPRVLPVGFIM